MILVIPIKNQYEQYCNAAALSEMGVITVNQVGPSFSNTVQNCLMMHPLSNWMKLQKLMSWLSFSSGLHLSVKAAVIRRLYFNRLHQQIPSNKKRPGKPVFFINVMLFDT